MAAKSWLLAICFMYVCLTSLFSIDAKNTLSPHQVLKKGQTLISANERFELGFFNASQSWDSHQAVSWFLGIWYTGTDPFTVVWVANRSKPLRGDGLKLLLNSAGEYSVVDDERNVFCLARTNQPVARPLMVLLDSGNLVIRDGKMNNNISSEEKYLWQSFDFPSDTLLPGMKLGWDLGTGTNRVLTSWRTCKDPYNGDFVFSMDSPGSPQLLLQKNGVFQSRWGPWDGKRFSGIDIRDNSVFSLVYHSSRKEVYFTFEMLDDSILLRLVVNSLGAIQFLKWKSSSRAWVPMVILTKDICDRYKACGPYAVCYADDPGCQCLKGFVENSPSDWGRLDCTDGCRRKHDLNCSDGDGFVKYEGLKLPDRFTVWRSLNSRECRDYCLKECACMAYTNIDIYGNGIKCVVWLDKLIDIRDSAHGGDELYIRMARVELESISHKKREKNIIIGSLLLSALLGTALWWAVNQCILQSKKAKKRGHDDNHDIPLLDMRTVSAATNNFCPVNKIGEGGFGPVYEGELQDGQKIAVKRLSEHSNQGLQEFKNEVNMIAQLQHRNLVKLLGCCIEGDERMLIYEYMPNKSLDQFIFDPAKKSLLPWGKRISILKGVAKGLDYLHSGSRLRIVHRDLKASNILLDDEMDPKISDFGLARHFENEIQEVTRRVIGTYGYMSPEYVMDGRYSTRSDAFSFGVLAIEIISGQKNWGFHHPDHDFNLLGHAWKLWSEGRPLELVDPVLEQEVPLVENEIVRCIQVGLLCVQHSTDERPTMCQVISMLENESISMPDPLEPGFFRPRSARGFGSFARRECDSINGLTVTELTARS